jgi:hypothetical protein
MTKTQEKTVRQTMKPGAFPLAKIPQNIAENLQKLRNYA